MNTFQVMCLFADQLRRNVKDGKTYKTKVVVTPSALEEKGLILKVTLQKSVPDKEYQAKAGTRTAKFRVQVAGTIESQKGLEQACELIENLDKYLMSENLRLEETVEGENSMTAVRKIPDTRISTILSPEDSFVDSPDSTTVQDVEDNRTVVIDFPLEE